MTAAGATGFMEGGRRFGHPVPTMMVFLVDEGAPDTVGSFCICFTVREGRILRGFVGEPGEIRTISLTSGGGEVDRGFSVRGFASSTGAIRDELTGTETGSHPGRTALARILSTGPFMTAGRTSGFPLVGLCDFAGAS